MRDQKLHFHFCYSKMLSALRFITDLIESADDLIINQSTDQTEVRNVHLSKQK